MGLCANKHRQPRALAIWVHWVVGSFSSIFCLLFSSRTWKSSSSFSPHPLLESWGEWDMFYTCFCFPDSLWRLCRVFSSFLPFSSSFFQIIILFVLFACVDACGCMCHGVWVEARAKLMWFVSLPPPCGFWGSDSHCQAQWQMLLFPEPSSPALHCHHRHHHHL